MYSSGLKVVREIIATAWLLYHSIQKVKILKADRMDVIVAGSGKECVTGCNGLWLKLALDVLAKNSIDMCTHTLCVHSYEKDEERKGVFY